MSPIGRPTSVGIRFMTFRAVGVKRRMHKSFPTMIIGVLVLAKMLARSPLRFVNSAFFSCSSSLSVCSSSLVDWSSSLDVSSSSFMLCNSSLLDWISSFAA